MLEAFYGEHHDMCGTLLLNVYERICMLEAFYGEQRKLTCVSCVMVTHDHSIVNWSVPVKPLL